MTANRKAEEFTLDNPNWTPKEAAKQAVALGWFGSERMALQAIGMARGSLQPERTIQTPLGPATRII